MAEQSTSSPSAAVATRSAGNRPEGSGPGMPLQTERGNTTIADAVVTKVASIAAREVPRRVQARWRRVARAGVGHAAGRHWR